MISLTIREVWLGRMLLQTELNHFVKSITAMRMKLTYWCAPYGRPCIGLFGVLEAVAVTKRLWRNRTKATRLRAFCKTMYGYT